MNEAVLRKVMKTDIAKADYEKAMADQTVTECIEESKAPSQVPSQINGCGTFSTKVVGCCQKKFFLACPKSNQVQSQQCQGIRKMLEGGPPK